MKKENQNTLMPQEYRPRSSDPFYIVSYYIKWVTTSWTYSTLKTVRFDCYKLDKGIFIGWVLLVTCLNTLVRCIYVLFRVWFCCV
mgnify:CR=1 FL=1